MNKPSQPAQTGARPARRSNEERKRQTRAALIKAARDLFVRDGYAETGTPEIVKAAKVTRGALYHHFTDKADLLKAVVTEEAHAVAEFINAQAAEPASPLEGLLEGANAYFAAMSEPGRAKLLLMEGPTVLGMDTMAQIDAQAGGSSLLEGLTLALGPEQANSIPLPELADVLSAAFDRAALAIARGAPAEPYQALFTVMLTRVLVPQRG
ncbi:MAG: TetR/AcrR family transcriptional regulator [Burkholderiaceae bacterium]